MESRIPPSHDEEHHDVGSQSVREGEDEHHPEKKSMLNRAKDKARKMKETFKKHGGYGHNHEHDHNDDHIEEEEEKDIEEEEVMRKDPEVQGAPIYESAAMKKSAVPVQPRVDLDEDHYDSKIVDPPVKPFGHLQEGKRGQPQANLGTPTAVVEAHVPEEKPVAYSQGTYGTKVNDTTGNLGQVHEENMEEDPHAPKDGSFPTGEVYESAAMRSVVPVQPRVDLEKPTAMEEDHYDSKIVDSPVKPFGQLQDENIGQPRSNLGMPTVEVEDHVPEEKHVAYSPATYGAKVSDTTGNLGQGREENMEEDPLAPKDGSIPKYQAKTTDRMGEGAEETATPILHSFSKMGVCDEPEPKSKPGQEQEQSSYTGSHDQSSPDPLSSTKITTSPGSVDSIPQSYDLSKPQDLPLDTLTGKPSEEGSYKEKIISAPCVIDDKAVSVKDAVASKLGYDIKEETGWKEMQGQEAAKSASPTEYAHEGGEKGSDKGTGHEGGEKRLDKRVSAKEYLAEKFRPSDDDKALSEVISGALHKRKEEEPEKEENTKPMGKVTELGSGEDNSSEGENTGVAAAGNVGVVDRVIGAVGSWFGGKGGDSSQASGDDGVAPNSAGGEDGHKQQDVPGEAGKAEAKQLI